MMNNLTVVPTTIIEFTITNPLVDDEAYEIISSGEYRDIDVNVARDGRIVVFDTDDLKSAISILSDANIVPDIGLIRMITEYDIIHDDNELQITVELDK